jgi:hypothetical protein
MRQPVLKRIADGLPPPPRPQPAVNFPVQFPKLVAKLDLATTADLLTDTRPAGLRPRSTAPMYRFRDASQ